jgi:hypothetical protein
VAQRLGGSTHLLGLVRCSSGDSKQRQISEQNRGQPRTEVAARTEVSLYLEGGKDTPEARRGRAAIATALRDRASASTSPDPPCMLHAATTDSCRDAIISVSVLAHTSQAMRVSSIRLGCRPQDPYLTSASVTVGSVLDSSSIARMMASTAQATEGSPQPHRIYMDRRHRFSYR